MAEPGPADGGVGSVGRMCVMAASFPLMLPVGVLVKICTTKKNTASSALHPPDECCLPPVLTQALTTSGFLFCGKKGGPDEQNKGTHELRTGRA